MATKREILQGRLYDFEREAAKIRAELAALPTEEQEAAAKAATEAKNESLRRLGLLP